MSRKTVTKMPDEPTLDFLYQIGKKGPKIHFWGALIFVLADGVKPN